MAHVIKCPNCNGPLPAAPAGSSQKCPFCAVDVQRAPGPQPPGPPAPPHGPPPVAGPLPPPRLPQPAPQATHSSALPMVGVIFAVIIVMGASLMVYFLNRPGAVTGTSIKKHLEAAVTKAKGEKISWATYRPYVLDVNGDGVDDVVGKISDRESGKTVYYLATLDGKTFKLLWRGQKVPKRGSQTYLAPAHLLMTHVNVLRAFSLESGKQAWQATLPDRIEKVYKGEGTVVLKTKDKAWHEVTLESGAVAVRTSKKQPRFQLPTEKRFDLIPRRALINVRQSQWKDLRVQRSFCPSELTSNISPKGRKLPWHSSKAYCYFDGPGLAYAVRAKGSKVPFLIGFDPRTREITWKRQLTPEGSLEELGSGFDQPRAELYKDRAAFLYHRPEKSLSLDLVKLDDGKVLWSAQLTYFGSSDHPASMVLRKDRLYVTAGWGKLAILAAEDGKLLKTFSY